MCPYEYLIAEKGGWPMKIIIFFNRTLNNTLENAELLLLQEIDTFIFFSQTVAQSAF